jgi:glycerol kinase
MQCQADLLGMPVAVSLEPDMTALGAAYLAAIGAGYMSADEAGAITVDAIAYEPSMGSDERESLWAEWRKAVDDVCQRARR